MGVAFSIGVAMLTVGGLRLMDIAWPTKPLPAAVYVVEAIIGFVIAFQFAPR